MFPSHYDAYGYFGTSNDYGLGENRANSRDITFDTGYDIR